jgi:hypothetical protein
MTEPPTFAHVVRGPSPLDWTAHTCPYEPGKWCGSGRLGSGSGGLGLGATWGPGPSQEVETVYGLILLPAWSVGLLLWAEGSPHMFLRTR